MLKKNRASAELVRKKTIRGQCLRKLRNQSSPERKRKSGEIGEKLVSSEEFRRAKTVMFYVSKDGEVDTRPMIQHALKMGKRVAVPVTVLSERKLYPAEIKDYDNDLSEGPYGILEPRAGAVRYVSLDEIDLVVVPGVAFDRSARRLGRGKGYYDRFLKSLPGETPRVGLAFDFQMVKDLPVLPHDEPVSKVLSA